MLGYRLYFLNADGHIANAAEFECAGDEEALLYVEDQRDGRAMELWSAARIVERFPADADHKHGS